MNNSSSPFYDLVIIGTGVAASTVAYECNSDGWKIAIIDYSVRYIREQNCFL